VNYPFIFSGVILSAKINLAVLSTIQEPEEPCYPEWDYYFQRVIDCPEVEDHSPMAKILQVGDKWHGYEVKAINHRTVILTMNGCDHVINVGEPFWDQD